MTMNDKFSVDDFKKWMSCHNESQHEFIKTNPLVGTKVEPKIDSDRIAVKMTADDLDDEFSLAESFERDGGEICDVDGKLFRIKLESGDTFYIHRCYVRRS